LKRREETLTSKARLLLHLTDKPNLMAFYVRWSNSMTKLKLVPAVLIAAAMLTTPVVAREHHPNARHLTERAQDNAYYSATPGWRYLDGRYCTPAPRVGAFASQPWDNDTPCEPTLGY
jgi:hypothetical protein